MERRSFLKGVGGAAGLASVSGVGAAATLQTGTTAEEIEILRDEYGEPHVYADSVYALGYGNGYVQADDRLFQMDVIRHVGYGNSAQVLGPAQIPSDVQVKRDLYSREEIQRQWETAPPTLREAVQGFADGVNRRMVEMAAEGNLPAEFAALGHAPEPWKPQDTVAAINYLIGFFGVSGGAELGNARTLYRLQENLGSWAAAFEAYGDLNWLEVPDEHYASLSDGDVDVDGGETVPDAWSDLPAEQRAFLEAADPDAIEPWGIEGDLTLPDAVVEGRNEGQGVMAGFKWGSNALVVSGELSASGEPLLGGGPQMGYFKPPIPYEMGLHGAGYDMSGIGVTGAPSLVIGRTAGGEDADALAWTVTSGRDDQVDTIAVELDSEDRHRYRWEGQWHEMETRREQHVASPVPPALGGEPATRVVDQEVAYVVEEGDEMPVIAWNPEANVAWCQRKTTRYDELRGAMLWTETAAADDLGDFEDTIEEFPYTFNFHVVSESGDIAYYHTGKVPERADGPDYRFPRSSSSHAWLGIEEGLGLDTWTRNPERGYVVNWNNGPATGWRAGDGEQNWGSIHRVDQLDRILREAAGLDPEGRRPPESATAGLDTDDVAEIVHLAALHDASAYVTAAEFAYVARSSGDPFLRAMGEYLQQWADADADWFDDDGDVPYTDGEDDRYDQPGHAIHDEARSRLQEVVFDVLTAPGEPGPGIDWAVQPSRHAAPHGTVGDDVTFVDSLRGDTEYDWFEGRRRELIESALRDAADALEERFGTNDVEQWLEPTHKSTFLPLGGTQPEEMDMRNRASYNQALDVDGWRDGDADTWQAAAGDVLPPGNDGVITAAELAQAQATGEEPVHLTDQLELYVTNEYKPHPTTREQVEQVAVERTTIRAVPASPTAVEPSGDVSGTVFDGMAEAEAFRGDEADREGVPGADLEFLDGLEGLQDGLDGL
jgi:penicillin amidase